jgi:predicted outer membrane repeat protein
MASLNRRFALTAAALPILLLVVAGSARAIPIPTLILVNTTDGDSDPAPLCTLPDAIVAANTHSPINGCNAGDGNDTIAFNVTGQINIDETLDITDSSLQIVGPDVGGITISGEGSVEIIDAHPGTFLSLRNLTFANGFATEGGAIFANGIGLQIFNSTFRNNTAQNPNPLLSGVGGALYTGVSSNVTIVNTTFANNTAVAGVAPSFGGALENNLDNVFITNCTFSGNSATHGGAIDSNVQTMVKSTILANNSGKNCSATFVKDEGFNVADDTSCGFTMASSTSPTNPLLDPAGLENNGGPTETIALEPGSPAINRIPLASCTDQQLTPKPIDTDQRLFARPDPLNLTTCDSGAFEFGAVAPFVLNSEKFQIARSSSLTSDQVNLAVTFTENGDPDCDSDENALTNGIGVELVQGTCANLPNTRFGVSLTPFVVHTVNHQSYGTLFQMAPTVPSPETVSARLVKLTTPENSCGKWSLTLQVTGLNTSAVGLGGSNPFALLISDLDDSEGCFDITDAIVGGQIPPPTGPTRRVRRGTRR